MLHAARALRPSSLRTRRTLALRSRAKRIYDAPTLYDAAFGFRDFEDEVDFLCAAHEKHGNTARPPAGMRAHQRGRRGTPSRRHREGLRRRVRRPVGGDGGVVHRIATENDVALDYHRIADAQREPRPSSGVQRDPFRWGPSAIC